MPVLDPLLAELPAQLDELAIPIRGEVDQSLERAFELDSHSVEAGDRFEQLELRAADRIASLLVPVAIFGAGRGSLGFVLCDPRLVLQLGHQSREFRDLRDYPAHARQLFIGLVDCVGAEPLHGSTIAAMVESASRLHLVESGDAKRHLAESKVARLATVSDEGRPHIVPIVFAMDGDTLYFAVDAKPKTTTNLKRLKNIAANPAVSVLADHYEDDWSKLWWVRADGTARIVTDDAEARHATGLLADRYAQFRRAGSVVAMRIDRVTGWSGA